MKDTGSLLDRQNVAKNHEILLGFFLLFWLCVFFYFLNLGYQQDEGITLWLAKALHLIGSVRWPVLCYLATFVGCAISVPFSMKFRASHFITAALAVGVPVSLFKSGGFTFGERTLLCFLSIIQAMKTHSFSNAHKRPDSATMKIFLWFWLAPSLNYELVEKSEGCTVRLRFVAEKALMTVGCIFLVFCIYESLLLPLYQRKNLVTPVEYFLQSALPLFMANFLMFFAIFEGLCNVTAELTGVSDRSFYEDWWNSRSFEEFSRKWNKIVHRFLRYYVYVPLSSTFCGKRIALAGTFFISSILHELAIAVMSGKLRCWFLLLQMLQLPLIALGNLSFFKERPIIGNVAILFGLIAGPSLILVLYS